MPKAKKDMTPAERAAARIPQLSPEELQAREEAARAAREEARQEFLKEHRKPKARARRAGMLVGALVLLCVLSFTLWTCNYSHETETARASLSSTQEVAVDNQADWIAFGDPTADVGFVLYPGGKVAAEAYAPLMRGLAEDGIFCVITRMPFNLAFFNNGAIEGVMAAYSQVSTWYLGGHSLGGVAACQWAAAHPDKISGLVLLASYSSDDLTSTGLPVLSIYGSEDGVMSSDAYEGAKGLLPADLTEVVIEGGNHVQFGDYGEQAGDGTATISADDQRKQAIQAIESWIKGQ